MVGYMRICVLGDLRLESTLAGTTSSYYRPGGVIDSSHDFETPYVYVRA